MSQKKSKSKSNQKIDKPPKQGKAKKTKQDKDSKGDAKSKKSNSKADNKNDKKQQAKSKVSKAQINQSQSQMSFFKPILFPQLTNINYEVCQFHSERNIIFCQICQQVGCQSCLVYGPHNNQMHRIIKMEQAYKSRYLFLNEMVCGQLIQKRELLNKRLQDLTQLCDQLRYYKNGVQKITKIEFNEMMERLKLSSGGKFAVLHHQMAELQKDLQAINALGNQFFELTNMNPQSNQVPQTNPNKGMVPFLLRTRHLQQQAQELISKPIKATVDIYPYDLPRQLTQRKLLLEKNKPWTDLLSVKDEVIWRLLQQKKSIGQKLWNQFYQQATDQVDQWEKLKAKIQKQIDTFRMGCSKCHIILDQQNINSNCSVDGEGHIFLK